MTDIDSSPGDVGEYLAEIARYPLLTPEEELELGRQVAQGKRAARRLASAQTPANRANLEQAIKAGALARQRMIECNLRLVVSVARHYTGRGLSLQDLIQEGNIGLQTGIDKFDWRRGYRLSTYIYWWIRQAMTRAIANDSRIIRLPVHAGELLRSAARAEQQIEAESGRQPSAHQIAACLGVDAERLLAVRRMAVAPTSLEAPLVEDGATGRGELLEDESASAAFEQAGSAPEVEHGISEVLEDLPDRERSVIRLHYGLGNATALTLSEIGQKMGITRERARQIESQAFRRLRGDARIRRAYVELATG